MVSDDVFELGRSVAKVFSSSQRSDDFQARVVGFFQQLVLVITLRLISATS